MYLKLKIMTNKDLIFRIVGGIVIIAIILLSIQQCNNNRYQQLKGEYDVIKEQYKTQKDGVAVAEMNRIKEKDSLTKENTILKDLKDKSTADIASLKKRIKDRVAQGERDRVQVRNLTLIQVAQEINTKYQTQQATATNNSVDLQGDLSKRVLQTVYDADECQDIVSDKDSIIEEQKTIIVNSEKETVNVEIMLNSAEKQIKQQKELQELADKNIDNLEKQNKKLRVKSTVGKILTGIGVITGIFIGSQL